MSVFSVIFILMNCLDLMSLAHHITTYAATVAIAAPNAPQTGMKIAFNTIFTTADKIVVEAIVLLSFAAENNPPWKLVNELNITETSKIDEYCHATKNSLAYRNRASGMLKSMIPLQTIHIAALNKS